MRANWIYLCSVDTLAQEPPQQHKTCQNSRSVQPVSWGLVDPVCFRSKWNYNPYCTTAANTPSQATPGRVLLKMLFRLSLEHQEKLSTRTKVRNQTNVCHSLHKSKQQKYYKRTQSIQTCFKTQLITRNLKVHREQEHISNLKWCIQSG